MSDPVRSADDVAAKLHATLDAQVWADEFLARFTGRIVGDTVNRYLLTTWFANAIEMGRAAGRGEHFDGRADGFDADTALFRAIQVSIQSSTDATDGNVSTFFRVLREQGYEVRLIDGPDTWTCPNCGRICLSQEELKAHALIDGQDVYSERAAAYFDGLRDAKDE